MQKNFSGLSGLGEKDEKKKNQLELFSDRSCAADQRKYYIASRGYDICVFLYGLEWIIPKHQFYRTEKLYRAFPG